MESFTIHLGLPKTATTLLQQYCFDLIGDKYDYLGVRQPRASLQQPLFEALASALDYPEEKFLSNLTDIKRRLIDSSKDSASRGSSILISEECFLLDSAHTTWQQKVERLGVIFKNQNVHILLTIRDPVSAVHSYYIEMYHKIKQRHKSLLSFALNDNRAEIFHYDELDRLIKKCFPNARISIIPYELLKNNQLIPTVCAELNVEPPEYRALPNINAKHKSDRGTRTKNRSFTNFIRANKTVRRLTDISVIRLILRPFASSFSRIQIPFS